MRSPSMTMRGVFDGRPVGAVHQPRVLEHEDASGGLSGDDGKDDKQYTAHERAV